jgi:hypothetical protein
VNPERVEGAAFTLAGRAAVNADGAADPSNVQRCGWVEPAALAAAVRTAVAAGVWVVGMVMQPSGADAAAIAVAGGVAVDTAILRLRLEETDSLGAWMGHGDAIIIAIYRVAILSVISNCAL